MADPMLVRVFRPLDLLVVRFELHNLTVVRDASGSQLTRQIDGEDAIVVVRFPPQHVLEEAFEASTTSFSTPVRARLSASTRLAFRIPSQISSIPFTLEALLDWKRWDPLLVRVARPRGESFGPGEPRPEPVPPEPTETAIELPYHVVLSPSHLGGWVHALHPVMDQDRAELWHTRLAVRRQILDTISVDENDARDRDVRVVWSPDFPEAGADPFPVTLDAEFRSQLVKVSADFAGQSNKDGTPYTPVPVAVERLMLSSVGGWLQAQGDWDPPEGVRLSGWTHRATQGRDHFVRVVAEGVLFPFGHRAAHVEISERTIEDGDDPVALMRIRHFIVVREPERTYTAEPYTHQGREMPFRTGVRMVTRFSEITTRPIPGTDAFWVMSVTPGVSNPPPLPFHVVGCDAVGRDVHLRAALVFVPRPLSGRPTPFGTILQHYVADRANFEGEERFLREITARGGVMALAEPGPAGDTSFTVDSLTFSAQLDDPTLPTARDVPFRPFLHRASVRLRAVAQLAGGSGIVTVSLARPYLDHGMDDATNNAAQLFATLIDDDVLDVKLPAERTGALAKPDLAVRGLSRHLGPLAGDLGPLAKGTFDAATFFPDDSKLLGAVPLGALLADVLTPNPQALAGQVPKMVTVELADMVRTTLDWQPTLEETPPAPLERRGGPMTLSVRTVMEQPLKGGAPRTTTAATVRNFAFNFVDVLRVNFDSVTFTSETGRKPDVSAELAPTNGVEFLGPLAFLNRLRSFIPSDGFSDPPAIDVSPSGIQVGYSLPLPSITVGVFALENVRLGASLYLPFVDGRARLRFSFAERHERFVLTVQGLGGGGFLSLALGLDGIEMIEAALEFGAHAGMDFGVASGGVTVMAGVYFRYEVTNHDQTPVKAETQVTGYVRASGELEVLGLISVSVEFFLGLSYQFDPERIEGEATLVIKVDLTLFSQSVEITVRRSFAKSAGDPGFGEVMGDDDWALYAGAFA